MQIMTKFIAIVSGKGGVGKTTVTINLGHALSELGKKVLLLDANLVTPNLGIHLGLMNPEGTLNKYLRKEKNLREVTYLHESGVSVIPASPSFSEFQKTNTQNLTRVFEQLDETADFVLIDAPSGLGHDVTQVLKNSDEAIIVVTPYLSSLMDALKTIQLIQVHNNMIAGIVLNMSNRGSYELKPKEIEDILNYPIIANIRQDKKMRKAVYKNMPCGYVYPRSNAARECTKAAEFISFQEKVK